MVTPEFKASIDTLCRELAAELQVPERMLRGEVCREDAEARAKGVGSIHHTPYGSMSSYPAVAAIVTSDPREMKADPIGYELANSQLRQQLADVSHERDGLRDNHRIISAAYLQLKAALGNEDMDHTDALAVIDDLFIFSKVVNS